VSSFVTTLLNILGHSVPYDGVEDICKH